MVVQWTSAIWLYTVPCGSTVDQYVYIHFFHKILRPKVRQTRSQMLNYEIILHDSAHSDIAMSVTTTFQKYSWELLNHPPYGTILI